MHLFKKILIVLIVVILSIAMFGCEKKDNNDILSALKVSSDNNEASNNDNEVATISTFGVGNDISGEFQKKNPNILIDPYEKSEDDWFAYYDDRDVFLSIQEELFLEIIAGGGPDIVCNFRDDKMYELVKRDLLYDMTEYIEDEENFNKENYAMAAIEIGKIDGKQQFIPLQFYVPALASFTNVEVTDGIEKDAYITWDMIKELGLKYTGDNETKYFLDRRIGDPFLLFNGELIDYSSRKSYFTDSDFLNIVKMNNEYYSVIPDDVWEACEYNDLYIAKTEDSIFHIPFFNINWLDGFIEEGYDYYIYPIQRTTDDKSIRCRAINAIAINKSAKYKDACFEFIRFKISELTQISEMFLLPTNKAQYLNYLDYIQSKYEGVYLGNFITSINTIYDNLEGGYLCDWNYGYDEIYSSVDAALNSEDNKGLSEDDILSNIDKQVTEAFKKD